MSWRAFAREPLVHFVVLGAAIFAIDAWRGEPREAAPVATTPAPATPPAAEPAPPRAAKQIVIDDARRTQVRAEAARRLGRDPTAAELDDAIERWIDEEVLYQEALARGLDGADPIIHHRIAERMRFVLEQSLAPAEPTDAELRAYFEQHVARWAAPDRVDFTHVFVAGTDAAAVARIEEIERTLAAGSPPDRLGDTFTGGRRYRGRKPADLALAFGDDFVGSGADALIAQPVGTWRRRTSKHGLHVVRIDRVESARAADFAAAKLDVRQAWLAERKARDLEAATRRLRESWSVVREP